MDDELRRRLESLERNQRTVAGIAILAVWALGYEVCTRGLGMNPSWAMLVGAVGGFVTLAWLSARVRGL
jgi:hypothetical protein